MGILQGVYMYIYQILNHAHNNNTHKLYNMCFNYCKTQFDIKNIK